MLETMPYSVWTNAKISLGLLDGVRSLSKRIPITWNVEETTILSAELVISASSVSVYGTTAMRVYMNGHKIVDFVFYTNGVYTDRVDVSAFLLNGPNQFDVEYEKNPIINPGAELTITETLEIAYEGEQPPPPPPDLPEWWPIPVVIVAGIGAYFLLR